MTTAFIQWPQGYLVNAKQVEGTLVAVLMVASFELVPIAFASPPIRTSIVSGPIATSTSTATATAAARTCLDGGTSGPTIPLNVSVAVVKPVFTATPYSQYASGSFYAFYKKYSKAVGNITTDLQWLNTSVKSGLGYNQGWGHSDVLYDFLASAAAGRCGLVMGKNLHVISDMNVSSGDLLSPNGSRMFDAVILGHEEYVTRNEYNQLRSFVAAGGKLVAMDSNDFYAEVRYNPTSQMETFVLGHGGYAFNGRTAWYNETNPQPWNTSGWFGSTYCCFHRFSFSGGGALNKTNPLGLLLSEYFGSSLATGYVSHEENRVSNFTGTSVVATFIRVPGFTIASYVHRYGRGGVFCFCVFGDDLISYDKSTQYFLLASLVGSVPPAIVTSQEGSVTAEFLIILIPPLALIIVVPVIILARRRMNSRNSRASGGEDVLAIRTGRIRGAVHRQGAHPEDLA